MANVSTIESVCVLDLREHCTKDVEGLVQVLQGKHAPSTTDDDGSALSLENGR